MDKKQSMISEKNEELELCDNCGSIVTFNIDKQLFECSHCQAVFSTKSEEEDDYIEYQADSIIPFQLSEELVRLYFYEWLAKGEQLPVDVGKELSIVSCEQLYIPFSLAQIDYECDWSADVGYRKTESSMASSNENGISNNTDSPRENKQIITDWSFVQSHLSGQVFTFSAVSDSLGQKAERFFSTDSFRNLKPTMIPFDARYLIGTTSLKIIPDQVTKARYLFEQVAKNTASTKVKTNLPGDTNRNMRIANLTLSIASEFVYIPSWKVIYQYKESRSIALVSATSKNSVKFSGDRLTAQPENDKNSDQSKYKLGLVAFVISLLLLLSRPSNALIFLLTLVLFFCGLGVWIVFGIKSKLLHLKRRRAIPNLLAENEEYLHLAKKYRNVGEKSE
ncbi:hypothetical protein [Candidatus Enterococcus mansonii]|uniref:hypothetical protein n=1 Tax=Candidatus Enterococcus mansonii TaxID=1834181 RepID=UPI00117750E0|nr:hypothetical protein [Enterococcus sp. 4G2_DIV0659]